MGFKKNPKIKKFGFTHVQKIGTALTFILLTLVSEASYAS
jgi:hypothetical protein